MAAKEFAAFVRRKNHRMAVILVYAVLEWILISLLLLGSFLSYLSYRFASYFGLKTPCLFCSRLEHHFHPEEGRGSYRELLCEDHAAEVTLLGYCSIHRKLAEATSMCEECSSSRPLPVGHDVHHPAMALLSLMKSEREGKGIDCSCCRVPLESGYYSMDFLLKPSCVDTQIGGSIQEKKEVEGGRICDHCFPSNEIAQQQDFAPITPECAVDGDDDSPGQILDRYQACERGRRIVPVELIDSTTLRAAEVKSDEVIRTDPFLDLITAFADANVSRNEFEDGTAVPVLIAGKSDADSCMQQICGDEEPRTLSEDSNRAMESAVAVAMEKQEEQMQDSEDGMSTDSEANYEVTIGSEICATELIDHPQLPQLTVLVDASTGNRDETENTVDSEKNGTNVSENSRESPADTGICDQENVDDQEIRVPNSPSASEVVRITDHEDTCKVSVSSEFCCKKQIGDDPPLVGKDHQLFGSSGNATGIHNESDVVNQVTTDDDDTKSDRDDNFEASVRDELYNEVETDVSQLQQPPPTAVARLEELHVSFAETPSATDRGVNYQPSATASPQLDETLEDRAPETPNSFETTYNFHKRFFLDRKESSTESIEGSIASELEISEVSTVDQLKAALKTERRSLNALYAELEEERSASAIAANQTMAMITRLQQEKAAMQMEALQYQRMMEEQSEYDQEALHLLNDLVTKKEKEKQELEKELEIYRKKVCLKKDKQMGMKSSRASGDNCISPALSSAEDSDDLSVDPNEGEEHLYDRNTPIDDGITLTSGTCHEHSKNLTLDESLADFEEERISILEELRLLEEKLFTMDDGQDSHVEALLEENGHGQDDNNEYHGGKVNGNHDGKRNINSNAKRLLPLFDATLSENEDALEDHELTDFSQDSVSKLTPEQKNHALAEEMNYIYQRLHALEVDKEFLKHSMRSMKNGGKGLDILLEIVQHLRELRNLNFRISDAGSGLGPFSI